MRVFSGPMLDDANDQYFYGLIKSGKEVSGQIPQGFWKITVDNNGDKPAAFGFVLDHDLADVDPHAEMAVPSAQRRYIQPVPEIEQMLNGLARLTWSMPFDQFR